MKHLKFFLAIFLLVFSLTSHAQVTTAFDKEIAPWHKKATMQCGMIKANPVNAEQILKNLSELEDELKVITGKYLENPPKEYEKDGNWKSYFQTLAENIVVVRERVEKKQFAQASIYCSTFCKTFAQMHKINGRTDLTDIVFSWRMEIKNTNDMFNAGNTNGVNENIVNVEHIFKHYISIKSKLNNKNLDEIFKPLEDAYLAWLGAIKAGDKDKMNVNFKRYMDGFAKPYMASF